MTGPSSQCHMLQLLDAKHNYVKYRDGAFHLVHGTEYKVVLTNEDPNTRVDATIFIDNKDIGTFRINKSDRIIVERPADRKRKLTFFSIDSEEGRKGGLDVTTSGTIKVVLKKEKCISWFTKHKDVDEVDGSSVECDGPSGGTALGRTSTQTFTTVPRLCHSKAPIVLEAKMLLEEEDDVVPL